MCSKSNSSKSNNNNLSNLIFLMFYYIYYNIEGLPPLNYHIILELGISQTKRK